LRRCGRPLDAVALRTLTLKAIFRRRSSFAATPSTNLPLGWAVNGMIRSSEHAGDAGALNNTGCAARACALTGAESFVLACLSGYPEL
jgi:hypothetical protein